MHTHTRDSFGSNGAAAATAARTYRHSRLDKNSAGLRDSELEALYERRGPRRHVSRIRSNKLRGIGNRAQGALARKTSYARSAARFFAFISYVHVYAVYAQDTPARDCPRLCYDRSALLGGSRRSALTTHNDTAPTAISKLEVNPVRAILIFNCYCCFFIALSSISIV